MKSISHTLPVLAKLVVIALCICNFALGQTGSITPADLDAANTELKKNVEAFIASQLQKADAILFSDLLQSKKPSDQRMYLVTDARLILEIQNSLKINPRYRVHTDSSGQQSIARVSKIFSLPELSLTFFQQGKPIGTIFFIDENMICGSAVAPDDEVFALEDSMAGKIYSMANKLIPGFIPAKSKTIIHP